MVHALFFIVPVTSYCHVIYMVNRMAHNKLLLVYIIIGMQGYFINLCLYFTISQLGACFKPMSLLILACLLVVTKHIVHCKQQHLNILFLGEK